MFKPSFKLPDGHEPASAASHDAQLGQHVRVEEVSADAERAGCFVWAESQAGPPPRNVRIGWVPPVSAFSLSRLVRTLARATRKTFG